MKPLNDLNLALSRRTLLRGGMGLIGVAFLSACSSEGGGPAGQAGETADSIDYSVLNLPQSSEAEGWNPALLRSGNDQRWRWMAVYDTLLRARPGGEVEPGAAESFEFSDDSRVLSLTLRSGMTFSDGSPVDAAAVKASIENMQNGGGTDASRVAGLTIETPDDLTVVLTSPEPRGLLPVFMSMAPGVVASPAALQSADLDTVPVSSGPYELDVDNTTSGSVYSYTKRADYWDADSFPYEKLVITVMTDPTARLNALRTGQMNAASLNRATAPEAEASGLPVTRRPSFWAGLFIMDRNGTRIPALGDARVRQAINMAFNRDDIASGLYGGEAVPTTQIFHPDSDGYIEELNDFYAYDLDQARRLMADAGYADGFDLTIPSRSPETDQANPLIIQQLGELNITVTERPLSGPTALNDLLSGEFDVFFQTLGMASPLWDTVQSIPADAVWNTSGSSDPRLDPMLADVETLRGEEATANFQAINRFCVEEGWFAPWVNTYHYFALDQEDRAEANTDFIQTNPHLWDFA